MSARASGNPEGVPDQVTATRLTKTWPAVPEAVADLRSTVVGYARRNGADPDALSAICLAVSEAATNAVMHAYPGAAPGAIHVEAECEGAALRVVVSDEGGGMVPRPDSPGLGLGLPL